MKVTLYGRVSTDDKNQNPETQLLACREYCKRMGWEIVREFVDYSRAKDWKHRKEWNEMLKDARARRFDCVIVYKLDRAFRSVRDCSNQVQEWDDRGIQFKCITQDAIDTTTSMGKFVLQILAAAAELESSLISDRVKAGIARTRAQGNRYGRKAKPFDWTAVKANLEAGVPITQVAKMFNYSRRRIYRALEQERAEKVN
jgi:DNA invertase Pin-like site-specific DNA recombinase